MNATCCAVVIGHVDHGKTTLVRALTGVETDRLAEEKARGLSITPGFAPLHFDSGTMDLIDAPGHEDFIPATIRAASGASLALVVVSAIEGIRAQTVEHLHIAALLGISRAIVAVTQSDLLTEDAHGARLEEITRTLADGPFADAPVVMCSAKTGAGIAALKAQLEQHLHSPASMPYPLLCIDRAFSLDGRGTVVTGTLLGKPISLDMPLMLHPAQRLVGLRGLHCRGDPRAEAHPGERLAANLRGVALDDVKPGDVLTSVEAGAPTTCMDILLSDGPSDAPPLKHMQNLRVYVGTARHTAQVRLYRPMDTHPTHQFAQLRFDTTVFAHAGQRLVLRSLSPLRTLGGGMVLDTAAQPTKAGDAARVDVLAACYTGDVGLIADALAKTQGGAVGLGDVARLARISPEDALAVLCDGFQKLGEGLFARPDRVVETCAALETKLQAYHDAHPLQLHAPPTILAVKRVAPPLQQHAMQVLVKAGLIAQTANGVALNTHDPIDHLTATQRQRMETLNLSIKAAGLSPASQSNPDQPEDNALINLLVAKGTFVALRNVALKQTVILHTDAVFQAAVTLRTAFPAATMFTTSAARQALGTSRKIIVPLLEHFDSAGITQRKGDTRQMTPQ